MICPEVHKEVARLDGYLDGIAASANGSRRYSAGAFLIELAEPDACIEQAIRDCKSWYSQLAFAQTGRQRLPRGLGSLESEMQPFLVREVANRSAADLENLREYLSFRVMDALWFALEAQGRLRVGPSRAVDVWRLDNEPAPDSSDCTWFCVRVEWGLVVLQFNDDLKWQQAVESGRVDPLCP
ncbi:hypothetical protein SAMN04487939_12330 [Lysobacter sp. yr284]|uniref:hypothetical protein n=1 Tax=Lysobacter TaxID=68 RepID=UPI0008951862|nr:hypothetical protein [Lysobacter sp. yr284]SDZ21334.1 hypothetical protein SAMN04487939_12330 [Lysobacter sp. yr284]